MCDSCAELCCKDEATRELEDIHADTQLLKQLRWGVYRGNSQHDRPKFIQSKTVQEVLNLFINNAEHVQDCLPGLNEVFYKKRSAKMAKATDPPKKRAKMTVAKT